MNEVAVRNFFRTRYRILKLSEEWLSACVEWLRTEEPQLTGNAFCEEVFRQWLSADFKDIEVPYLPSEICTAVNSTLPVEGAPYPLQVTEWRDISQSAYSQLEKLGGKDVTNNAIGFEEGVGPFQPSYNNRAPAKRMAMFVLTDGIQTVRAMEYETLTNFQFPALKPGGKVLVEGGIQCRRGILLLEKDSIRLLGGEVEALLAAHSIQSVLNRELGMETERNSGATEVAASLAVAPSSTHSTASNLSSVNRSTGICNDDTSIQPLHTLATGSSSAFSGGSARSNTLRSPPRGWSSAATTVNLGKSSVSSNSVPSEEEDLLVSAFEDEIDPDELLRIEEECMGLQGQYSSGSSFMSRSVASDQNFSSASTKPLHSIRVDRAGQDVKAGSTVSASSSGNATSWKAPSFSRPVASGSSTVSIPSSRKNIRSPPHKRPKVSIGSDQEYSGTSRRSFPPAAIVPPIPRSSMHEKNEKSDKRIPVIDIIDDDDDIPPSVLLEMMNTSLQDVPPSVEPPYERLFDLKQLATSGSPPPGKHNIRGFIYTLSGKLSREGGQWSLQCHICDGTDSHMAYVGDELLARLVGFTVPQAIAVQSSGNASEMNRLRQGFSACRDALIALNGVLTVEFQDNGTLILLAARDVSSQDVEQLKQFLLHKESHGT